MIKQTLLEQFTACYDENSWFVALKNAVSGVTAEQAAWKPENADISSIWEILSHLNYYNYAYLERFKGVDYVYPADDNDETFSSGEHSEDEWQAAVEKFDSTMKEFRTLIESADESKFDEPVSATNQSSWATLISNINTHNAHHGGQIVLLRKLQGNWNREKGVS